VKWEKKNTKKRILRRTRKEEPVVVNRGAILQHEGRAKVPTRVSKGKKKKEVICRLHATGKITREGGGCGRRIRRAKWGVAGWEGKGVESSYSQIGKGEPGRTTRLRVVRVKKTKEKNGLRSGPFSENKAGIRGWMKEEGGAEGKRSAHDYQQGG